MAVRVSPGPVSTAASRLRAEQLQELRAQELELVRTQAEKWRNGLAGLLALIATVTVVKGRESVADLSTPIRITVGALLLTSLLMAAVGAFLGMRAAYGLPRRRVVDASLDELIAYTHARARSSVRDTRRALFLTFATLAGLVLAIALTWYAPSAPDSLARLTTTGGTTICGRPGEADPQAFRVAIGGEEVAVPRSEVSSLVAVASCEE